MVIAVDSVPLWSGRQSQLPRFLGQESRCGLLSSRGPASQVYTVLSWGKDPSAALDRASPVCTEMGQLLCLFLEHLYLPKQDLITPGKSQEGASDRKLCAATVSRPSCPVQTQHDKSTAPPPCGSQRCLNTLHSTRSFGIGCAIRSTVYLCRHRPANQGGGWSTSSRGSMEGSLPLAFPAYNLAGLGM